MLGSPVGLEDGLAVCAKAGRMVACGGVLFRSKSALLPVSNGLFSCVFSKLLDMTQSANCQSDLWADRTENKLHTQLGSNCSPVLGSSSQSILYQSCPLTDFSSIMARTA